MYANHSNMKAGMELANHDTRSRPIKNRYHQKGIFSTSLLRLSILWLTRWLSYPLRALLRRHNDRSVGLFCLHVSLFLVLGTNQVGGVPGPIKGRDMRGSPKKKPKEEIPIVQWFRLCPYSDDPLGWFLFLKRLQGCMKRFRSATLGETLCRVRNCKSPMSWTRCSLLTTDFVP